MKTSFYSPTFLVALVSLFAFSFTASSQAKYSSTATLTAPVDYQAVASFLNEGSANRTATSTPTPDASSNGDSGVVVSPILGAISGPAQVCGDDEMAVTYSISVTTINGQPATFYWFVPSDWVILSGQGSNSIEVMPGHMSGTVAVFAMGHCICSYSCMPVTNECDGPITPLPVELISFDAARSQSSVLLSWSTAQELNNDRFDIERSLDGRNFSRVASVKGMGTTQQRSDYRFTDVNASTALSYYRLKQIDADGKSEYSSVKAVRAAAISAEPVSAYPNPTAGVVNIQLPSDLSSDAVIRISSVTGQVLYTGSAASLSASNNSIDMSRFNSGIYLLSVTSGKNQQSLRITKM